MQSNIQFKSSIVLLAFVFGFPGWMESINFVDGGRIVRWSRNTHLNDAQNWETGHVPCVNERIVFPADIPSVYVQNNITTIELVLPNNGEVIIGNDVSISFPVTPSNDAKCRQQDNRFIATSARSWFDPYNWCDVADISGDCLANQPDHLDVERIPCQTDSVVFPSDALFLVNITSSMDVTVGSLTVSNQVQTTSTFRTYLDSAAGRKQFVRDTGPQPTTITIRGLSCSQNIGCECGNSEPLVKRLVCSMQTTQCGNITCDNALQVNGHCCHICGAALLMNYGPDAKLKTIENLVKNTYMELDGKPGMKLVSSRTDSDQIQVIIADETDGERAVRVGYRIKQQIETDNKRYGITDVSIRVSGRAQTGAVPLSNIVGIVVGLIILAVILLLALYCTSSRRRPITDYIPSLPTFSLPTFNPRLPTFIRSLRTSGDGSDLRKRTGDMELSQTVMFDNSVIFEREGEGFDNPNFGIQALRFDDGLGLEPQPEFPEKGSFTNPLYATSSKAAEISHIPPPYDDKSFPSFSTAAEETRQVDAKKKKSKSKQTKDSTNKATSFETGMTSSSEVIDSGMNQASKPITDEDKAKGEQTNKPAGFSVQKLMKKASGEPSRMEEEDEGGHSESEWSGDLGDRKAFVGDRPKKTGKKKLVEEVKEGDESGFGNPLFLMQDVAPPRRKWELQDETSENTNVMDDDRRGKQLVTGISGESERKGSFENPMFEEMNLQ